MEDPVADPGPAGVQALVPTRQVFQASVQEFGSEVNFQCWCLTLVKTVASYHALLNGDLKIVSTVYIGFYDQPRSRGSRSLNPMEVAKLSGYPLGIATRRSLKAIFAQVQT